MAKCERCGKRAGFMSSICDACIQAEAERQAAARATAEQHSPQAITATKLNRATTIRIAAVLIGGFIGFLLGFLLRPSVPLIGQLPFTVVITRGLTLEGLDQMLIPAAKTSFNYTLAGAILGALAGLFAPRLLSKNENAA